MYILLTYLLTYLVPCRYLYCNISPI